MRPDSILMFLATMGRCSLQLSAVCLVGRFAQQALVRLPVVLEQLRQQGWVE
jgi:hypothetical protein